MESSVWNSVLFMIAALAAMMDFLFFRVKNWLILTGIILGMAYQLSSVGKAGVILGITGMLVPVLCLGLFFVLHLLGAGDIKLLCVIGSFIGPIQILTCMGVAILIAGFIGAVKLLFCRQSGQTVKIRFAIPVFFSVLLYQGGFY